MKRWILLIWVAVATVGSAYAATENNAFSKKDLESAYSIKNFAEQTPGGDYTIVLALSGGGTRAAAIAYGVLKALRAETLPENDHMSLLDEVDVISSVSGGSFVAAYYGLFGEKIFSHFEDDFLYYDVDGDLVGALLDPTKWFSDQNRTDKAIEYYQNRLFKGATFSDLQQAGGPLVIINASDLGNGVRFSFLQEYFDPLCSELSTYPVANAVAASSAVPVVFNPVVLKNHDTCDTSKNKFLDGDVRNVPVITRSTVFGLLGYTNKTERKFIHLIDGGITDNLGLLSLYDTAKIAGRDLDFYESRRKKPSSHYVIISVDASAVPENSFNLSAEEPSITDTVSAMSNIQFLRYNASTRNTIEEWMQEYVTTSAEHGNSVKTYFVNINLSPSAVLDDKTRKYLNDIPTALSLEKEQVDAAILEGYSQLQNNPDFIRFRRDIREENRENGNK